MPTRRIITCVCAFCLIVMPLQARTYTVSKSGDANYTSIQAAINAADMGDEIIIKDASVYKEQVSIDSTKSGLILRSDNLPSTVKPTILYQDKSNVGPTTCAEAKDTSKVTFWYNGALRIIGAAAVRVEGIVIDGGGVYPFGYTEIWKEGGTDCRWPNQHGNAAICCYVTGETMIRDCDIKNAFFGMYVLDRNEGGIFTRPGDHYPGGSIVPFSGFARTGNHLIEYNRIHDNSFGLFFESMWDMGSTIRYNLIYENHHPTSAIAQQVKGLTPEGPNLPGGAFLFKDDLLCPLSIYNNTFWHNMFLFVGNWNPSGVHLIFNNIFGEPFAYWGDEPVFGGQTWHEMSPVFTNRMHNCVFAAQQQKPAASNILIMNDMGQPEQEGDPIPATFPATADVRYLETHFLSTDPGDVDFLTPDWSNTLVDQYIVDKGWPESGVKDPGGTPADLGAIAKGGGRPVDVVTIHPARPIVVNGMSANLDFYITPRIGTMTSPKLTFLRFVRNLDTIGNFGNDCPVVAAGDIITLPIPPDNLCTGTNFYRISLPAEVRFGTYGFYELIVEGTGTDGRSFTTATGFIPFRNIGYLLEVELWNREKTAPVAEARCGEPVVLRVKALRSDGVPFDKLIDPTDINLQSPFDLLTPAGSKVTSVPGGIYGTVDLEVVFSRVPAGGVEYVTVAGKWVEGNRILVFLGSSDSIKILPGAADSIAFQDPRLGGRCVDSGMTYLVKAHVFDKYGNKCDHGATVRLESIQSKTEYIIMEEVVSDSTGLATFSGTVFCGAPGDTFPIVATLMANGKKDETYLICNSSLSINHIPATSFQPRDLRCELVDLRGRVVQRVVTKSSLAAGRDVPIPPTAGRGVYLVRTTDIATGKVTMRQRLFMGR